MFSFLYKDICNAIYIYLKDKVLDDLHSQSISVAKEDINALW